MPLAILGALLGVLGGLAYGASLRARAHDVALRAAGVAQNGAGLAPAATHRRLENLVEGLCTTMGVTAPRLAVIDDPALNSIAASRSATDSTVVVTTGLLDSLGVVELEGVIAAELVRIRNGSTALATVLSSLPVAGRALTARWLPAEREFAADAAACLVTRYPPGLAGALEKFAERGTEVRGAHPRLAALWLAGPSSAANADIADRIASLREW